jgi:hypothetical protein
MFSWRIIILQASEEGLNNRSSVVRRGGRKNKLFSGVGGV